MALLSGLTVVDLTRVLSGPFATQQLVDLGARILKVEKPGVGDDARHFGPPFLGGESTYFMSVNRGKESIAIDLKHPGGRELVFELAMRADVVIENFRPGTIERLGLAPSHLRASRPELITCSISGYGSGGTPEAEGLPGYDAVLQATTGLMSLTGPVSGPASKVGVAIADMVAGLYATQGILAALVERGRTGRGRHIEISMQDAMCSILTSQAALYFATGKNPERMGNAHPSICPYETVDASDGPYALAVGNDAQFARLCVVIHQPGLPADPRFATNARRVEHRALLMPFIEREFLQRTRAEWDAILRREGVPGGAVLDVQQALLHPQLSARGSILTHDHPRAGPVRTIATPVRVDGATPAELEIAPPPILGQHTRTVLRELLRLEDSAIDALEREGAIGPSIGTSSNPTNSPPIA